jgi:sporulation protein YlmC with PRC-barrel domain
MTEDGILTWDGKYFGWIEDDDLFTKDGRHVGQLRGVELFATDGRYLGELRDYRLVTRIDKKGKKELGFAPLRFRMSVPMLSPAEERSRDMPSGYEDFPLPDTL